MANFFFLFVKNILSRKYWRGGGGLLFEIGAIDGHKVVVLLQ